jgi:hypothetical protein
MDLLRLLNDGGVNGGAIGGTKPKNGGGLARRNALHQVSRF